MTQRWEDPILQKRKLTIFATSAVDPNWRNAFQIAIDEFNRIAQKEKLDLELREIKTAPGEHGGGADVQFDTLNGARTFHSMSRTLSLTLDGNSFNANTFLVPSETSATIRTGKAFIFVPATPQMELGTTSGSRDAGEEIKIYLALHEMVHAFGLEDSDHTLKEGGVFGFLPDLSFVAGKTAAQDRIKAGNPLKIQQRPFELAAAAVRDLKLAW